MTLAECFAEIKKSGIDGRGLFASKAIKAGGLVFKKSRPLVTALDSQRLGDTCANCFQSKLAEGVYSVGAEGEDSQVKKCTGCRVVAYCSKTCQLQHWKRSHKNVCKVLKNAITTVPDLKENPQAISNVTFALVEMIQMRDKSTISESEWISVLQLKSHAKEMKEKDPERYREAEVMAERALLLLDKPAEYSEDFVIQIACAVLTNSLTLVAPTCDPLGLVFDPFACLANHSCEPNTYVIMNGAELSFRALKDIPKDQEILVAYIDSTEAHNIRQAQLTKRFYFTCNCAKCKLGPVLPQDIFLTSSIEQQRKFKEYVDGIRRTIPETTSIIKYGFGLDDDKLTHSDLIDCSIRNDLMLANELELPGLGEPKTKYDTMANFPANREQLLEIVLQQCQMSGQYAVTRQPYAAARNEYILEKIAKGQFSVAWLHAVKSYVEIDPVLYPEPHNPLRVVHAFRLAKLSTFLASEPTEENQDVINQCLAAGLDMPILAWRCMKEAALNADASHGANSPFTHMAKAMFKAAIEDTEKMTPNAIAQVEGRLPTLDPALKKIAESLLF